MAKWPSISCADRLQQQQPLSRRLELVFLGVFLLFLGVAHSKVRDELGPQWVSILTVAVPL